MRHRVAGASTKSSRTSTPSRVGVAPTGAIKGDQTNPLGLGFDRAKVHPQARARKAVRVKDRRTARIADLRGGQDPPVRELDPMLHQRAWLISRR